MQRRYLPYCANGWMCTAAKSLFKAAPGKYFVAKFGSSAYVVSANSYAL